MYTVDQSLAVAYHAADLRDQARRDALARRVAPRRHGLLPRLRHR